MDGGAVAVEPLVNTTDIATVFGVSEVTIKKWLRDPDDPMPVVTEGGNGVAYEFRVSDCRIWYEKRKAEGARQRKDKEQFIAQQRMEFLGLKESDGQANLTAAQMRELAQAQLLIMQAAERRRALIHVVEVKDLLDQVLTEFQAGLDGLPDWLEREFSLDGDQVERAVEYADQIFAGALRKISKAVLDESEPMPDEPDLI